jgi:hypothetical protein
MVEPTRGCVEVRIHDVRVLQGTVDLDEQLLFLVYGHSTDSRSYDKMFACQ